MCDDNYTPAIFDSKQFEIVSDKISQNWVITQQMVVGGSTVITLSPKEWTKLSFWVDYFDMVPEAIAIFERKKYNLCAREFLIE